MPPWISELARYFACDHADSVAAGDLGAARWCRACGALGAQLRPDSIQWFRPAWLAHFAHEARATTAGGAAALVSKRAVACSRYLREHGALSFSECRRLFGGSAILELLAAGLVDVCDDGGVVDASPELAAAAPSSATRLLAGKGRPG